ncbi:MAG TPA: hypothetical protein IGS52_25210 [Oscillatoriaceae cyanobacterium M33_DOE_052]|uniref:Uncharacterized protein n=1 Tax=Planktothricoides sp. SpSt-374 TaxID=2282167 RepID=A0A7C3ZH15_9CYAN|nr:hypothetical protein [Oscillatoriaceae cyanobacterium M33_DOE_052]
MSILPYVIRSLLIASLLSFAAPSLLLGVGFAFLYLAHYVPWFATASDYAINCLLQFLATFGSGNPLEGVVVIGVTASVVGALFDTYALFQYSNQRPGN